MALEKVANDYSKYCDVDLNKKLDPINKSIDDMMARLEEFQTMISFVQQDSKKSTDVLTSVMDHSQDFNALCDRIDKVDSLVIHIKTNLYNLEEEIARTEEELGCCEAAVKVSNIFTPLFVQTRKAGHNLSVTLREVALLSGAGLSIELIQLDIEFIYLLLHTLKLIPDCKPTENKKTPDAKDESQKLEMFKTEDYFK